MQAKEVAQGIRATRSSGGSLQSLQVGEQVVNIGVAVFAEQLQMAFQRILHLDVDIFLLVQLPRVLLTGMILQRDGEVIEVNKFA